MSVFEFVYLSTPLLPARLLLAGMRNICSIGSCCGGVCYEVIGGGGFIGGGGVGSFGSGDGGIVAVAVAVAVAMAVVLWWSIITRVGSFN